MAGRDRGRAMDSGGHSFWSTTTKNLTPSCGCGCAKRHPQQSEIKRQFGPPRQRDQVRRHRKMVRTVLRYGFLVWPWFVNVAKALRKEPKWFLRDWSGLADEGARAETVVACHLLKAVETWTDQGLGNFELRYLRDKEKREVDFLVVRDEKPWFLVEAKVSDTVLSPSLRHFQDQIQAPHAFQVVRDLEFVQADPFLRERPTVVPARTLLSMLP